MKKMIVIGRLEKIMKKTILIILLCGIIVLAIIGCGTKVGKKSDVQISQNDVSLMIKDGTLTTKSATLILKNNSNKKVQYGEEYTIEIKKHGEWYKMNSSERWFNMVAFLLNAGESKEIEVDLEYGYGKLKKGTYRIIKSVDYVYENGKYENFNIAVEYTIE